LVAPEGVGCAGAPARAHGELTDGGGARRCGEVGFVAAAAQILRATPTR